MKFLDGGAARMGLSLMDIGKTFYVCVIFVLNIFKKIVIAKMFISSK